MQLVEFQALRGPDGKVSVNKWDRICVPTGQPDVKDDMETEFSVETMSQMVDNFVDRGDLIPMDHGHQTNHAARNGQPAPALAWYGAFAVVVDGQIVKAGAARGIDPALLGRDGLDLSREGLWGCRTEVTELGEVYLPSFKYLSPTFTPAGTRRDGSECGYSLMAVAATNSPFQEGTQITFEKEVSMASDASGQRIAVGDRVKWLHPVGAGKTFVVTKVDGQRVDARDEATQEKHDFGDHELQKMEAGAAPASAFETPAGASPEPGKERAPMKLSGEMLAKLGLGEDASPEECFAALQKHFEAAEAEKQAKMAEDAEMAKLEADKADDKKDDKDDAKMAAMQATLEATRKQLAKLEAREAEREQAAERERQARFEALADQAIAGGYPKEKRSALVSFARVDYEGARSTVEHFLPKTGAPAHLFDRMSENGAPVGKGRDGREISSAPKARQTMSLGARFVEKDAGFADKIREYAFSSDPTTVAKLDKLIPEKRRAEKHTRLLAAEKVVRAEYPDLAAAADAAE